MAQPVSSLRELLERLPLELLEHILAFLDPTDLVVLSSECSELRQRYRGWALSRIDCRERSKDATIEFLRSNGEHVRELTLGESPLTSDDICDIAAHVGSLSRLTLVGLRLTDIAFLRLPPFASLHTVDLGGVPALKVGELGCMLGSMEKLRHLRLPQGWRGGSQDELVAALRESKCLLSLEMPWCSIEEQAIVAALAHTPFLRRFVIKHFSATDALIKALPASCPHLRELAVISDLITPAALADIARLERLTDLELRSDGLNVKRVEMDAGLCGRLERLHLSSLNKPADADLAVIFGQCSRLRSLSLVGVRLGRQAAAAVAQLAPRLQHVALPGCSDLTGRQLSSVLGCASPSVLCLDSCTNMSDDVLLRLLDRPAARQSLRVLSLNSCDRVSLDALQLLGECPHLEQLSLIDVDIAQSEWPPFVGMLERCCALLRHVDVANHRVPPMPPSRPPGAGYPFSLFLRAF